MLNESDVIPRRLSLSSPKFWKRMTKITLKRIKRLSNFSECASKNLKTVSKNLHRRI